MREDLYPVVGSDFPKWRELMVCRALQEARMRITKKQERALEAAAQRWLPYPVYWQGGLCTARAPFGEYFFAFCVEMEMERRWGFPEFQVGYEFGVNPSVPFRDANPYKEAARRRSWDCGYIFGLYVRELEGKKGG